MKKAVFLDRDGTIIRDVVYLNDPARIEVFTESYEAIKLLNEAGFMVILATNQSGIARGIVQEANLHLIHSTIVEDFKKNNAVIHDIYFSPHAVDSGAIERKPSPGMLLQAAEKHGIDLKKSWMVGDRMTDVEAGIRAGCRSILLQNHTTPPIDPQFPAPKITAKDMLDAARIILDADAGKK
jgi:D-glycero-D-manno-heptose 1,7-bisphosphate phosphatase